MEWGVAKNLIWLWTVPAAAAVFALAHARRRWRLGRFGDPDLVGRLVVSLSQGRRLAKRVLWLAALGCMVLALGQPHFKKKESLVERRGLDIVIAIDVSNSMLAKDIAPSRLEKAKLELSALIDGLKGDRIGIVAFAGEALIQCPITTDKNAARLFLSTANPNLISYQGTSLSRAIGASLQAFGSRDKESKALVLLTDGENHEPEALQAAKKAKQEGVRIFTIGVGTPDGSTVPGVNGAKKDRSGRVVISKLQEPLLRDIAKITDGRYYRASRGELEIEGLLRDIRQMKEKGLGSEWAVEYEENYQMFVLIALALLAVETFLSERGKTV